MSALPRPTLTLARESAARYAELSDPDRLQVDQRRALVDSWRNMCREFVSAGGTRKDATEAFLHAHPEISQPTLYRWAKRRDSDDPADLLDGRSKNVRIQRDQPNASRIDDDAWAYFIGLWLTIHRRSVTLCWQMTAHAAKQRGWTWPSKKTIERRIKKELPPFKADYYRLGQKEWYRMYAPKLRRNYDEVRSGEHVVGDFHEFDIFCRRSESDPTIIRPLLSAFMDLRSRVLWGWHICESENSDMVMLAFRNGCDAWGVPDQVTIDNGKPYRAYGVSGGRPTLRRKVQDEQYVRSAFGGLGVIVHFSIPFNPDSKPVERFFLTLEMQFGATFQTYCGGDKDDRFKAACKLAHDHPELCPTLDQLREQFGRWVEAYHATPHTGEGMRGLSPSQAFEAFDPIARKIAPPEALDVLLMRTVDGGRDPQTKQRRGVAVTSQGVRYQGDHYGQGLPELQVLIGQRVILRVDPVDASFVIVCDMEGKPVVRAYNNRRLYTGLTNDDIAAGQKRKKRARDLAKSILAGGLVAAHESVTDAAIAAKLQAGRGDQQQQALRTGTDDLPARGVQPLRSDMADSMRRLNRRGVMSQLAPTRSEPDQSFERAVEELTVEPFAGDDQQEAWPSLADLDEEL